jgi:lipid-A-disaccharide synthase
VSDRAPMLKLADLDVFLVAIEPSADVLGTGLMTALRAMHKGNVSFRGLGGAGMVRAGLASTGHIAGLASIGVGGVVARLPTILRSLRETVDAIVARPPDVLILIDAPDFTHRVAHRVRRRLPSLPVVKYVSPSVWAWRPGRARAMRPSIDLILALLPFEPEVHRQLGGPACVYVGHPLLGYVDALRPSPEEAKLRESDPPLVLALPGSRRGEVRRLGAIFGKALGLVATEGRTLEVVVPTLPHLAQRIADVTAQWPLPARIVTTEEEKYAAFRRARAALAASGTVTLELALAGIPSVTAYRVSVLEELIFRSLLQAHPVIKAHSVILANLVLGEFVMPEFLQRRCTPENLAGALADILGDTPARRRQIEAFKRIETILGADGSPPSARAALAVLDFLAQRATSR